MNYLLRYISSMFLVIFSLFLASPQLAIADGSYKDIAIVAPFGDICSLGIQCEQISEDQYICRNVGEKIIQNFGSIKEIPAGKQPIGQVSNFIKTPHSVVVATESKNYYISPETKEYPFVGIIKIQV